MQTKPILLLFAALLAGAPVLAQEHAIKLNLPGLLTRNITLAYEHSLSDKVALQLGIGVLPGRPAPGSDFLRSIFLENPDNTRFAEGIRFSGYQLTPELRYYPFKQDIDLRGFYVAPALRLARYALKTQYNYTTSGGEPNALSAKGTLTGVGINLNLGYHIPLASNLSLDLYLGGGGNASRLGVRLKDEGLLAENYREVETEVLEEFGLNPAKYSGIVSDGGIRFGFYLPLPVIRTGFALGYTF